MSFDERKNAYRCSVAPENSAATLAIGSKQVEVNVLDTSRDGFTIKVDKKTLKRLNDGRNYHLEYNGEKWEVQKSSHYSDGDAMCVGMTRIRELTRIRVPSPWVNLFRRTPREADPTLVVYLMIAFLFASIVLPGLGDNLGTAPKIRDGIHRVVKVVRDIF